MKKVACFLTCGYTETGAMQEFLEKLNGNVKFIQHFPNKSIKRKGMPKKLDEDMNGLTGEALINAVVSQLERYPLQPAEGYCAILVEDDTDNRFTGMTNDMISEYHVQAAERIKSAAGWDVPVIFLLASPEIEAWFIADWHNCFDLVYRSMITGLSGNCIEYFLNRFHLRVSSEIVNNVETIEDYPNKPGDYHKLSDVLINILADKTSWCAEQDVLDSRELYYSKKTHGVEMLRRLDANIVASKCRRFFAPAYTQIKHIL